MKVTLHVGPHRTGTTYIQYAAHRNRAYLARKGIHFVNQPAQSNKVAAALNNLRPDVAIAELDRLAEACKTELGGGVPVSTLLYSSETFFSADRRQAAQYEKGFAHFVTALQKRGHEVELVFVERDMEDLLTSNALLQVSLGNLKYVTPDPAPFTDYLEGFAWKKAFYFRDFKVLHLSFDHMTSQGDLFANFMKLAYGIDLPELEAVDPALDARNSSSDAQIAKGLVMAPLINWLEQFGSVSRFELFNAARPLESQVRGESWEAMVASVPLLRDCVRGTARRALEQYVRAPEAQPA